MEILSDVEVPIAESDVRQTLEFLKQHPERIPMDVLHAAFREKLGDCTNRAIVDGEAAVRDYLDRHPEEAVVLHMMLGQYAVAFRKRLVDDRVISQSVREVKQWQAERANSGRCKRWILGLVGTNLEKETALIQKYEAIAAELDALERHKLSVLSDVASAEAQGKQIRENVDAYKAAGYQEIAAHKEAVCRELDTARSAADDRNRLELSETCKKVQLMLADATEKATRIVDSVSEAIQHKRDELERQISELESRRVTLDAELRLQKERRDTLDVEIREKRELTAELDKRPEVLAEWQKRQLSVDDLITAAAIGSKKTLPAKEQDEFFLKHGFISAEQYERRERTRLAIPLRNVNLTTVVNPSTKLQLLEQEFDRQVEVLINRGCAKAAAMDIDEFRDAIAPLRTKLRDRVLNKEFKKGHIPFIVVPGEKLLSLKEKIPLMELEGKKGDTAFDPSKLKTAEGVEIPDSLAYLLIDVEDGTVMRGKNADEAVAQFKNERRSPMIADEGVALILQYPEILKDRRVYLPGSSRYGGDMVAYLWLFGGRPGLDWSWADNSDARWGSASCGSRVEL